MATSTGSQSAEETTGSSDGCITPVSNTYDSDSKSDTNEESLSQHCGVEEYHRCNKCKYPFSDPRLLNCFHSICLYCAEDSTITHEGKKFVPCPVPACKTPTFLRNGSAASDLVEDFALRRFIERLKFNHDDGLLCRSCKRGNRACARCFKCAMFLCEACKQGHQSLTIYNGHAVHDLGESLEKPAHHVACGLHPEQWASVYCHDCRLPFCAAACGYRHQNCKKAPITENPFSEWLTSVGIDKEQADKCAHYYAEGSQKMRNSTRNALADLKEAKHQVIVALTQQEEYLEEQIKQTNNQLLSSAGRQGEAYSAYSQELGRLLEFMRVQAQWAGPWDNLETGPFIVERLSHINSKKPDPQRLTFSFEFQPSGLAAYPQLGNIVQSSYQPEQLGLTAQQPQQPIARPTTSMSQSNNGGGGGGYNPHSNGGGYNNHHSNSGYNHSNNLGYNQSNGGGGGGYNQSNGGGGGGYNSYNNDHHQQHRGGSTSSNSSFGYNNHLNNQATRTSSSSNEFNAYGLSNGTSSSNTGVDLQKAGYEHFQTHSPRSRQTSGSPMTSGSQPNSASLASDTVFSFNNLTLTGGSSSDTSSSVTTVATTQQQQQPHYSYAPSLTSGSTSCAAAVNNPQLHQPSYQTWSNGNDQPSLSAPSASSTSSPPAVQDVFSMSNNPMFEAPTPQRNHMRSYPSIRRTRMQYIAKFGEYGNAEGQFTEPSGVTIDGFNRLVVADTNNHRIQIFDVFGRFKSQFGNHPDSKLTYPNRIAVSKTTGKVVITERAPSHRVQTYTLQGQPLDIFGEEILQHPRGVTVDKDDNIIIVECKVMQVTIFSMTGEVLSRFGCSEHLQFPNSVAVNNRQEIFISDNRAHNVKVFSYRGVLLRTIGCEGLTNYPIAVSINQLEQVVVADNHNNFNLTVFTQEGELVAGYESKTKHAQCFDLALTDDGVAVLTSKDFKVYCYPYQQDCPYLQAQRRY